MAMRKNEMLMNSQQQQHQQQQQQQQHNHGGYQQNDYYNPYAIDRYATPVGQGHARYQRPRNNNNNNINNNNNNNNHNHNNKYQHNQGEQYQGYHHHHHHHHYQQQQQTLQMTYDLKMSYLEELGICLDECRDQMKHLERDYRKADTSLIQEFRLRRSSGSENGSLKYPPNSTRVDKLIIDEQREHQKVESLIGRIERLGFTPMHSNVGVTLDLWLTSIKDLRNVRKNEIANLAELPHP